MSAVLVFSVLVIVITARVDYGQAASESAYEIPSSLDWRRSGCVSRVRNQGQCNSSWAFVAAESVAFLYCSDIRKPVKFSAQQLLVDCVYPYGSEGCVRGDVADAYHSIRDQGIDKEHKYLYVGKVGQCNPAPRGIIIRDYKKIKAGREDDLLTMVEYAPVAVAIDASHHSFKTYTHGVYYEKNCSSTNLNHAMLVVGFGTNEKGQDYWLVKNSWGRHWGEGGYIRMARNRDNNCGIASHALYPIG